VPNGPGAHEARTAEPKPSTVAHAVARPPFLPRTDVAPAASRTPPSIARAVATLPATSAATSVEAAPPDVHIHIGRIELTAVPEAPVPRRTPKSPKSPLSLDDYLRAKGGA
jgi:hypothetical protein